MLLKEAISKFLIALKADSCTSSTIKWYRQKLRQFAKHQSPKLQDITRQVLRSYVITLRSRELSASTIAGHIRVLKHFSRWLADEGYLERDPGRILKLPKFSQIPKPISWGTLRSLLDAATHPRDKALLCFLAQTGCRACEVCGLQCQNLDIEAGSALVAGKGNKERFVPLGADTQEALREWMGQHPGGECVFCNLRTGKALSYWGLRQIIYRLKRVGELNGQRCNLHSFRHFFAKEYLMKGGDLASLKDILGHSSITITEAAYVCFTKDELKRKHDRFAPSLSNGRGQNEED